MKHQALIPSVNFHLWEPCNFRCRFCFASFQDVKNTILPKGHLPKEEIIEVIRRLCLHGFEKITFVGGEPTLCPWLPDIVREAKSLGATTMIVTNGSKISAEYLAQFVGILDWVTISIDSMNAVTNKESGRAGTNRLFTKNDYAKTCGLIKEYGFRLKINTVVHHLNYKEIMAPFISEACPERWKVFKVLPIIGQNTATIGDLEINDEEFQYFVKCNSNLPANINIVVENNNAMTSSYLMIDPAGRFFDNARGFYVYSKPLHKIGIDEALSQINYNYDKFILRNGIYNW